MKLIGFINILRDILFKETDTEQRHDKHCPEKLGCCLKISYTDLEKVRTDQD